MRLGEKIRTMMRSFLQIEPPQHRCFTLTRELDFPTAAARNRLWYNGSAYELEQFYRQLDTGNQSFWAAHPSSGREIRKAHTGIPKIIVDTLAGIVIRDMNDPEIEDKQTAALWSAIAADNKIANVWEKALKDVLIVGDGAIKISFDPAISDYPLLEWVGGERVEYRYRRGRMDAVIFHTAYQDGRGKEYRLDEYYRRGSVHYELFEGDKPASLSRLPETQMLTDVAFDSSLMMAVPFFLRASDAFPGRGSSLFDGKTDAFDSLDEAWSQWLQAMRLARPNTYIPDTLLHYKLDEDGIPMPVSRNPFDNQFILLGSDPHEGAQNRVQTEQPSFPADQYNATYITALDLALQGLISPSTLGIDVKKLDNAEAQREKEKVTLYTRNAIIRAFSGFVGSLIDTAVRAYQCANGLPITPIKAQPGFGEYANPSFEAVVETLSNPATPMSIEARVEEMWGDSKDAAWKAIEVTRVKAQQGIAEMEEPAAGVLPES